MTNKTLSQQILELDKMPRSETVVIGYSGDYEATETIPTFVEARLANLAVQLAKQVEEDGVSKKELEKYLEELAGIGFTSVEAAIFAIMVKLESDELRM